MHDSKTQQQQQRWQRVTATAEAEAPRSPWWRKYLPQTTLPPNSLSVPPCTLGGMVVAAGATKYPYMYVFLCVCLPPSFQARLNLRCLLQMDSASWCPGGFAHSRKRPYSNTCFVASHRQALPYLLGASRFPIPLDPILVPPYASLLPIPTTILLQGYTLSTT